MMASSLCAGRWKGRRAGTCMWHVNSRRSALKIIRTPQAIVRRLLTNLQHDYTGRIQAQPSSAPFVVCQLGGKAASKTPIIRVE